MTESLIPILEDEKIEESKEIAVKTDTVVQDAKVLVIQDDNKFHFANDLLKTIKGIRKKIDDYFDPAIKKAHAAWKENIAMKKKQSEPVEQAERIIKQKIAKYHTEQEQKRLEEQRKRQEELRKQEEEKRLKEAEETGDESILEEPIVVPEIKLEDTTKHEGISYQTNWKFRVIDKKKVPEEYKIVDEKKVNGVVRAMKENTNIPGIEVYTEKITKARM